MNPPFAIGQKVICIKNVLDVKKGEQFYIIDIKYCCEWIIDIGHKVYSDKHICDKCNKTISLKSGILWVNTKFFAPIQHDDATSEILEKFKQTDEKPDVIKIKELI